MLHKLGKSKAAKKRQAELRRLRHVAQLRNRARRIEREANEALKKELVQRMHKEAEREWEFPTPPKDSKETGDIVFVGGVPSGKFDMKMLELPRSSKDNVNHPSHYNSGKIEVIEAIEDWGLCYHRGNVVKYVARAGKKDPNKTIEDLEKALWYLNRKIQVLKGNAAKPNDTSIKR